MHTDLQQHVGTVGCVLTFNSTVVTLHCLTAVVHTVLTCSNRHLPQALSMYFTIITTSYQTTCTFLQRLLQYQCTCLVFTVRQYSFKGARKEFPCLTSGQILINQTSVSVILLLAILIQIKQSALQIWNK